MTEAKINVQWIAGDITDLKSISQALKHVDVIIHTAAVIDHFNHGDKDLLWKVNVEGNYDRFQANELLWYANLIYFSMRYVFVYLILLTRKP